MHANQAYDANKMHAYDAYKMHAYDAYKMHAYDAYKLHAYEMHAYDAYGMVPVRGMPMRRCTPNEMAYGRCTPTRETRL